MTNFDRYIGIDYSGAETPTASNKGLRVYLTDSDALPVEIMPPPSQGIYWSRRGIAKWLVERLAEGVPTLVGIDHGFSFPLRYFEEHGLKRDWPSFLEDFQRHWPTDADDTWVRDVLKGEKGSGAARRGEKGWFRLTEKSTKSAKSVFNFEQKQGNVAFSTHAGIPWLRFIRQQPGSRVYFWPFDGWDIPAGRSAIVEVYPALWSRDFAQENRTGDQHDAFSTAAWLSSADHDSSLPAYLNPDLTPPERTVAQVEGWILGVPGLNPGRRGGHAGNHAKASRSQIKQPNRESKPLDQEAFADFVRALAFASRKHSQQRRKDAEASPYINHPISLVSILAVEAGINDRDTLCAALLHDTIEDTNTSVEELIETFGSNVASLVQEVTDDKCLSKAERKLRQVEHAAHLSPKAGLVKFADKISNLRDVAENPPADWPLERRQEYFDWAKQVVDQIPDPPAKLLSLFNAIYDRKP